MTTLVVDELDSPITQTITIKKPRRVHLIAIRPNLLFVNNPSGSLKLSIEKDSTELFEKTLTISALYAGVSDANMHGVYSFEFDTEQILENGNYDIVLTGVNGYSYSLTSFVGWIKPHEHLINVPDGISLISDTASPFGFEMWVKRGDTMPRILDFSDTFASGSAPTQVGVSGSSGTPNDIVAGTGVLHSNQGNETIFVAGDSGAVNITASPQVEIGDYNGQRLTLIGTSDTNTVQFDDGTGLALNGAMLLGADDILSLIWDADQSLWIEEGRSN